MYLRATYYFKSTITNNNYFREVNNYSAGGNNSFMDKKEHKVWIEDSCWIQAPFYGLYISHITTLHIQSWGIL